MNQQNYYSRKELAAMIDVSVDVVRMNEKRWGIDVARRDINPHNIRYSARVVIPILKRQKLLELPQFP